MQRKKHRVYTCITPQQFDQQHKNVWEPKLFQSCSFFFFPSTYDISQDFDTSHTGLGNQNYFLIQTLRNITTSYTEVKENKFCKFYNIKFIVIT